MPSLIWGSIFLFLLLELALTVVLALPVPRKIRNFIAREICKFDLGHRLAKPILYIGIALGLALLESFLTHRRLISRMEDEHTAGMAAAQQYHHDVMYHTHDKERKYKSERNMYLAGFSLTLLFVIGRITTLMQESVELEEETERVQKFVADSKKAEVKQTLPVGDKKKD
jgi:hypothetical protein